MSSPPLFLLVEILEGGFVKRIWRFRAPDELAIARHVYEHAWDFEEVFRAHSDQRGTSAHPGGIAAPHPGFTDYGTP